MEGQKNVVVWSIANTYYLYLNIWHDSLPLLCQQKVDGCCTIQH